MKKNKIKLFFISVLCLLILTGCTITTDKETAEKHGGFLEWLGFEKCETKDCK
ncbi:MAG: hypothetical protein V8Q75_03580 [Bacilli bacterium]